ncbi:MAG: GNAT family N-acetyltransferase [Solobacterium sp.]|nr:GNAT family N-acetyltransferase [Solobacterium sp.]
MLVYSNSLTVKDYCGLRSSVGWASLVEEQAEACLEHSDFVFACKDDSQVIGCARVFWDKGYIAYLADVIVKPAYQGRGIGKRLVSECISYVDAQLKEGWKIKIILVSAKGRESFYEQFGFVSRPNEKEGNGMNMWRQAQTPACMLPEP